VLVNRAPIRNCAALDGPDACPQQWENLKASYVEGVRQCGVCKRNVYLCRTEQDVRLYRGLNYCFDVDATLMASTTSSQAGDDTAGGRAAKGAELPARFLRPPQLDGQSREVAEMATPGRPERRSVGRP
jgi:hypothetical protein